VRQDVAAHVLARGLTLSGSIITVDHDDRIAAAQLLIEADTWIHADVFGRGFAREDGASQELVTQLACTWPASLDIHIMADDPADILDGLQRDFPVARTTVHVRPGRQLQGLSEAARGVSEQFWVSIDAPEWSVGSMAALFEAVRPDGILHMLVPAGVSGHQAELSKTRTAAWVASATRGPIGADGGVTLEAIEYLVLAGVSYVVMGRALLLS
jgi:pentose-5-phosphate-3-epimerase